MDVIRPRCGRPAGRHFLHPRLAADLVRNAGPTRGDLVVEIGAGTGTITRELAKFAGRVVALELDGELSRTLARRFSSEPRVRVVHADALTFDLPVEPFRVVASLPFAHTTPILHRLLDDPARAPRRADVIVQWGFAVKRCSLRPATLLTTSWAPWYELTITRRLAASSFQPVPSVDCAVITITRRPDALLDPREHTRFVEFLRREFAHRPDARELDAWEWTDLFRRTKGAQRDVRDRAGRGRAPAARRRAARRRFR